MVSTATYEGFDSSSPSLAPLIIAIARAGQREAGSLRGNTTRPGRAISLSTWGVFFALAEKGRRLKHDALHWLHSARVYQVHNPAATMAFSALPPSSQAGTLHYIPPNLCAFEPTPNSVRSSNNTLVWIGGLFDTLMSVSYPFVVAQVLPPTWSLAMASLGSAGMSWGVSSIARDADEVAKIVRYFQEKRPGGKVVIMGHSTGCQDCIEYVAGPNASSRPSVHGLILQAPVSDREALVHSLSEAQYAEPVKVAQQMVREGRPKDALPNALTAPAFGRIAISAKRWLDIASPPPAHEGADDYFSSDLPDERLISSFGKIPASTPLLILYSGSEENVPPSVNTASLVWKWSRIVKDAGGQVDENNSGLVPGASHNLNGNPDEVVQDLSKRVIGFIERLDRHEFRANARI